MFGAEMDYDHGVKSCLFNHNDKFSFISKLLDFSLILEGFLHEVKLSNFSFLDNFSYQF